MDVDDQEEDEDIAIDAIQDNLAKQLGPKPINQEKPLSIERALSEKKAENQKLSSSERIILWAGKAGEGGEEKLKKEAHPKSLRNDSRIKSTIKPKSQNPSDALSEGKNKLKT